MNGSTKYVVAVAVREKVRSFIVAEEQAQEYLKNRRGFIIAPNASGPKKRPPQKCTYCVPADSKLFDSLIGSS